MGYVRYDIPKEADEWFKKLKQELGVKKSAEAWRQLARSKVSITHINITVPKTKRKNRQKNYWDIL